MGVEVEEGKLVPSSEGGYFLISYWRHVPVRVLFRGPPKYTTYVYEPWCKMTDMKATRRRGRWKNPNDRQPGTLLPSTFASFLAFTSSSSHNIIHLALLFITLIYSAKPPTHTTFTFFLAADYIATRLNI